MRTLPLILLLISMPSYAYYWISEETPDGCTLNTSTGNNINPKIYLNISFSFHPTGENQYVSQLGLKPELPFISALIADFSYVELVNNTKDIIGVAINGRKGIEYKGLVTKNLTSPAIVYYFDNLLFSNLYEKAKNQEEFSIEFDTKKGLYKTSLNFIYDHYGEDLMFKEKSIEFDECIKTHNKSLKEDTSNAGAS